jgi:DGQHR domain-containing protein
VEGSVTDTLPFPPDPDIARETVRALRVRQPIGDIYIASIGHQLVQKMTYFDVRRVLRDKRDIERYLGIQRPLNEGRVEQLGDYVNYFDATFPTSIIVAVDSDYAEYDESTSFLTLSNTRKGEEKPDTAFRNLCRVIDGQHRIAGLEAFRGEHFELIVSVFVGSDISDQAYIFATVNLEQTKVNKSLAFDLFDLAKTRSPYKSAHNIAVALDTTEGSPFYKRIKRLGVATLGRSGETLTQATFVNALVPYMSENPRADRDLLLRGHTLPLVNGSDERKLCFRNMFIKEQDVEIGKIIEEYFKAVALRWPEAWNFGGTGIMLNRTNGFNALMRVLGRAYNYLAKPGEHVAAERFLKLFQRVDVPWDYFSVERFKPGSSGEADLRRFLEREMFEEPSGRLFRSLERGG